MSTVQQLKDKAFQLKLKSIEDLLVRAMEMNKNKLEMHRVLDEDLILYLINKGFKVTYVAAQTDIEPEVNCYFEQSIISWE